MVWSSGKHFASCLSRMLNSNIGLPPWVIVLLVPFYCTPWWADSCVKQSVFDVAKCGFPCQDLTSCIFKPLHDILLKEYRLCAFSWWIAWWQKSFTKGVLVYGFFFNNIFFGQIILTETGLQKKNWCKSWTGVVIV